MKEKIKQIIKPFANPIISKINKFQGLHEGQECYLLAGGVSLKSFDFDAFNDRISLVMNHIPFHNDFRKLDARYCFLIEPYWFYPGLRTVNPPRKWIRNRIQEAYRSIIKQYRDKNFFINLSNFPVLSGENITYLFNYIPNSDLAEYFYSKGINPFHGTVRASVFMAIYLGFSKAYLVGYDYTHFPSRVSHWFEKGFGTEGDHRFHEELFFKIASEFISLKTVTISGGSEVLEYVTYKELTGRNPQFRENSELLTPSILEIIASRKDYKVF
jgi:hypothetical protein